MLNCLLVRYSIRWAAEMSTTRKTRKPPEQRRAEIVEAAVDLAGELGLDRLTGRDVTTRVGVTSGLLHHYFPHIDDVIAEAFREVVTADIARVADGLGDLPPRDALAAFLDRSMAAGRASVLALWMSAWVAAPRRPALAREVDRQMAAGVDVLAGVITAGVRTGEFTTSDAAQSAWRILVTLDGIAIQRTVRPPTSPPATDLIHVVHQVAENELGLPAGALHAA